MFVVGRSVGLDILHALTSNTQIVKEALNKGMVSRVGVVVRCLQYKLKERWSTTDRQKNNKMDQTDGWIDG